jgi:NADP-dependent 3-hydroxy acid dehydrogenase YdfG
MCHSILVSRKPSELLRYALDHQFPKCETVTIFLTFQTVKAMSRELNAVITGASSGIGRSVAVAIAGSGSAVCLVGRDSARLEAVAQAVRATARLVLVHAADLTIDSNVNVLVELLRQEFAGVDALVHCAGAYATGSFENTSVQQLDVLYRTNVRLPYELTQALLPLLKIRKGQIVFINSSQGLQAQANTGLFALTQHALKAMADTLRQEINAQGIRVLSVYPGRTATPRMKALYEKEGRSYHPELLLQPEDVAQVVVSALQLPRTAEITNLEVRPAIKSY